VDDGHTGGARLLDPHLESGDNLPSPRYLQQRTWLEVIVDHADHAQPLARRAPAERFEEPRADGGGWSRRSGGSFGATERSEDLASVAHRRAKTRRGTHPDTLHYPLT